MNGEAMTLTLTDSDNKPVEVLVLYRRDGVWIKCANPRFTFEGAGDDGWVHFKSLSLQNKQEIVRQVWRTQRAG